MFNKILFLLIVIGFQITHASQSVKRFLKNTKLEQSEIAGAVIGCLSGTAIGSIVGGGATLMLASTAWKGNPVLADSDEGRFRVNVVQGGASVGALTGCYGSMRHVLGLRQRTCMVGTASLAALGALLHKATKSNS